jgi:hypothetical protein
LGPLYPLPASECDPFPLPEPKGGHTHLWAKGWGGPNSDDCRTSLALCLLCAWKNPGDPIVKSNAEDLTLDMQRKKAGSALEAVKEPLLEAVDEVVGYVQDLQLR